MSGNIKVSTVLNYEGSNYVRFQKLQTNTTALGAGLSAPDLSVYAVMCRVGM
jgi:hypothetical protein